MLPVLAQAAGFTLIHWIIVIIILAAVVGIMFVCLRQFGIQVPAFMITIFWIVVAAVVGIVAIKFLLSLGW